MFISLTKCLLFVDYTQRGYLIQLILSILVLMPILLTILTGKTHDYKKALKQNYFYTHPTAFDLLSIHWMLFHAAAHCLL